MTSRRVGLTAAFLALAAGGAAACDSSTYTPVEDEEEYVSYPEPTFSPSPSRTAGRTPAPRRTTKPPSPSPTPPAQDVFYCADEEGYVVDDWYCDEEEPEFYDPELYYLWHSPAYRDFWVVGDHLPGGRRIAVDDTVARRRAGLPATGFVGNGSVKTNIVGRSSTGGGYSDDGFSSGG